MEKNETNEINEKKTITPDNYVPEKYRKEKQDKRLFQAIGFSFLTMLLFIGIQIVSILPFMLGGMLEAVTDYKKTASDITQEEVMDVMLKSVNTISLTILATGISLIVAALWYKKVYCKGYGIKDLKTSCKRIFTPSVIIGIVMAAICLFYLSNFLVIIIGYISPEAMKQYTEIIEKSQFAEANWEIIMVTVILAPVNEECIMRGIIFCNLKKHMSSVYAIVISAVFFGIFHLNIVQGIYAAVLGLFMAYLANKYQSILASLLFHAVFNATNYIMLIFPETVQNSKILSFVVPIITGILWYFLECRRKYDRKD